MFSGCFCFFLAGFTGFLVLSGWFCRFSGVFWLVLLVFGCFLAGFAFFSVWFCWFLPAAELGFQLQAVMSYPALQGMSQLVLGRGSCVILTPSAGWGGGAWGAPGGPGGAGPLADCSVFWICQISENLMKSGALISSQRRRCSPLAAASVPR